MAKILLFTIHDKDAGGIRLLGSYVRDRGHTAHLVFLLGNDGKTAPPILDDLLHNPGGTSAAFVAFADHKFVNYNSQVRYGNFAVPPAFLRYLQHWRPDIIGFSSLTVLPEYCSKWFADIRGAAPDALLVAGGSGPNAAPEPYLDAGADIVVRGEGEEALAELADCLDTKRSWTQVRNCSWKDGRHYRHNPLRPMVADLDSLPVQLLNAPGIFHIKNDCLLEEDPLFYEKWQGYTVMSGRGCIRTCSYCSYGNWRNMYICEGLAAPKYRWHSIEHLLRELQILKTHARKGAWLRIADDYFIRSPQEMLEFLQRYKLEIGPSLPISSVSFVPAFLERHPEILDAAIDAGLTWLLFAIQTGDRELSEQIFARKHDYPQLLRFAHKVADRFLRINIHFIDGYIFGEQDDLEAKLQFIRQLPAFDPRFPYSMNIIVFYLFLEAGVPLHRMWAELKGRFLSGRDFAYRTLLMQLRYILDDEKFAIIRANEHYKADPRPLLFLNDALRHAKHNAYLLEQAVWLAGQKVYFWGCGEIYQARKNFFRACKPQAILLDVESSLRELDGIKVCRAEDILRESEPLPIIIFSNQAQKIALKIKRLRPDYAPENIIACQTVG